MKVLKYIASVLFLAAVTLAALYFPNIYFQRYQYETVIEEMEQPSYGELGSSKANLEQVLKMLKDTSYVETNIYTHESAKTEADREIEMGYIKMVQRVFEKYIKLIDEEIAPPLEGEQQTIAEGNGLNDMLQSWMKDWIISEKDWQVCVVTLFHLANVFSGELITIQLYGMVFEIPNENVKMEIYFSPDTEIFYMISVMDERYIFDMNTANLPLNLYSYYQKNGESKDILEKYWGGLMNIYTFQHEIFVGIN